MGNKKKSQIEKTSTVLKFQIAPTSFHTVNKHKKNFREAQLGELARQI